MLILGNVFDQLHAFSQIDFYSIYRRESAFSRRSLHIFSVAATGVGFLHQTRDPHHLDQNAGTHPTNRWNRPLSSTKGSTIESLPLQCSCFAYIIIISHTKQKVNISLRFFRNSPVSFLFLRKKHALRHCSAVRACYFVVTASARNQRTKSHLQTSTPEPAKISSRRSRMSSCVTPSFMIT